MFTTTNSLSDLEYTITENPLISSEQNSDASDEDIETNFIELSSLLKQEVTTAHETIRQFLSASEMLRTQFNEALTSVPFHPYEKLKYQYCGADYKAPTLDDIVVSPGFSILTSTKEISAISEKFSEIADTQIRALSCEDLPNECNAFATLSENCFVVQKDKVVNHINFLEFIKSIPISVVEAAPMMVAQKILSHYISSYK